MHIDPPAFEYVVEPLPPSRLGRRWRWELWRGERLVAGGWHHGERRALVALRTRASRAAHELAGVLPLRPERVAQDRPLLRGATVRLFSGPVECVLIPRAQDGPEARAA